MSLLRERQARAAKFARASSLLLAGAIAAVLSDSVRAQERSQEELEQVIVLGRGETRQVQTVTAMQVEQLPPGTSPLKAISNLPGVNFQSADAYGTYEWSTRITVRGFNQNRMGFTLDGVPLGDMTYGNHNGLHISRAIPSEDIGSITMAQGTGALDTASTSNLGGTVAFKSSTPADEFGVGFEQMFGSDSARRTYARIDSGELGSGTRAYVSVVDHSSEKWRGDGDQELRMYSLKVEQPIGAAKLTAFGTYSDRAEMDYQDLSFDIIERRGREWDNFYPNWTAAITAADGCAASGFNDGVICDDAYWNAAGLRKDRLAYLALELPLGDNVSWNTTAYSHANDGQGLWGTPYVPTPGGAPVSVRSTNYDLNREGLISALTWNLGAHEVSAGVWFEQIDFVQARKFYGEPNRARPTRDFLDFQQNSFFTQWAYEFDTETLMFHLQDTWRLNDAVRLNFGFKSVTSENQSKRLVDTAREPGAQGTIEAEDNFLPQIGVNWSFADNQELFAGVAQNMRAFAGSATSGPFSITQVAFDGFNTADELNPETSTTYELGWRYNIGSLQALVAGYYVKFDDRLLGISQGVGIIGNRPVVANVGSVTTSGVEAAVQWQFAPSFTWFVSGSWNDSTYDDSYVTFAGGVPTVVNVADKQVVDSPEIMLKTELGYDNGTFFARVDGSYIDDRYYTYLNRGGVDSYTMFNAGLGYRFKGFGMVDELTVQLDLANLTDEDYIATIDSNGFVNSDPNGTTQTLLPGAPRQYFVSLKARF